ncbi:hypothetical protein GCM10023196_099080 [Actinoallomurus vinaceus]|uniref:Uncharacterized protein n=1 Tax=Actinoallomurus vinaceus TaxID=1080074 RepID=A0ABP8UUQ8_9ACTN
MLVYDSGVLSNRDVTATRLPAEELASHAFVEPERVGELAAADPPEHRVPEGDGRSHARPAGERPPDRLR